MGKVALITGGTRGIGYGIAGQLAAEGYDLVLNGVRESAQVQTALEQLRSAGSDVIYCRGDVSDAGDREAILAKIRERSGALHLLVNNAGVAPLERNDILNATQESFERVLGINLQGPYFLTQSVANWMIEQQRSAEDFDGCIVFITSISATVASTDRGEYCLSKAGLSMAAKLWAVRMSEFGIPVYEVSPGIIRSDMTAGVREKYDRLIAEGLMLQSRWGEPKDVGKVVASLARGDFAYSTGQTIQVDGGMTIQRL
ncbi:MAG TPA: 3-ketoacyl-ACP reductase [bacterium]|nr:3-ketoacyl-ACP reductase [bacterium]